MTISVPERIKVTARPLVEKSYQSGCGRYPRINSLPAYLFSEQVTNPATENKLLGARPTPVK